MQSLARVLGKTILTVNRSQGGGSTITQQLAKNLFPRDERSSRNPFVLIVSKFKEWVTAVKLEYNYTKEEILAMYLNTVFFGSNAYGIKSAAKVFFNKFPSELTADEAAVLVGVVNAPSRYNPVSHPERAVERRNLVLDRMYTAGDLSRPERDSLQALPIPLDYSPITHNDGLATYFREMIRLTMSAPRPKRSQFLTEWDYNYEVARWDSNPLYGWCEKNLKPDGSKYDIYRDGLKIYTTIDYNMQALAEAAIQKQMEEVVQPAMDAQYNRTKTLFRGTTAKVRDQIMHNAMRYSDRYRALKSAGASDAEINKSFDTPTKMKIFTYSGERDTTMTPRDSILHHKRIMRASFMAMEPGSGEVRAYVGGPSFRYFKYDMVKQGKRQVGSTIKPFIYAFGFNQLGLTPCTMVPNLPVSIESEIGSEPWTPKEAGEVEYDGILHPLRWGLANSRNNYSAWIMKQGHNPRAVADFIHSMGIHSFIDPVYALCLGVPDVSLFEMVGAYGTFANQGSFVEPIFVTRIVDKQGNVIGTFNTNSSDAISPDMAGTMLEMMHRVLIAGTGMKMMSYVSTDNMAGKTGTTDENRDGWFMCVTPKLVAGAWVGGEDQSVHLISRGEGSVVALPIVGEFYKGVYANPAFGINSTNTFPSSNPMSLDCENAIEAVEYVPDEFFDM